MRWTKRQVLRLDLVLVIVSSFLDTSKRFKLEAAAETGLLTLFDRVVQRPQPADVDDILWFHWLGKALGAVCTHGHLAIAKGIHELHPEPLAVNSFRKAAARGHVEMFQWLCEHRCDQLCIDVPPTHAQGALDCCFRDVTGHEFGYRHVRSIQWLFDAGVITVKTINSLSRSIARSGDMDTLKWLEAMEPTVVNMAHWFAGALERGDLAMVQVFECSAADVTTATVHGSPELVHFIRSELQVHGKLWLEDLLVEAARYGRVNLLAQHDYFILSCDQWGIVNGATYGLQLESIKWLCCHLIPRVDVLDLCYAIAKGRIDILQWVHDHLDARWVYDSSTFIAKTEVVKWIFQHRSSWLDLDPSLLEHHHMSMAAEAGNLELVQWLDPPKAVPLRQ